MTDGGDPLAKILEGITAMNIKQDKQEQNHVALILRLEVLEEKNGINTKTNASRPQVETPSTSAPSGSGPNKGGLRREWGTPGGVWSDPAGELDLSSPALRQMQTDLPVRGPDRTARQQQSKNDQQRWQSVWTETG